MTSSSATLNSATICEAPNAVPIRNDWSREEIAEIYKMPLMDLMYRAATVHRAFHNPRAVQQCTLLSIKTGGCPEDCGYCPQSAHYDTGVKSEKLLNVDTVVTAARLAKEGGSTRFCMGAAWRDVKDNAQFDQVIDMVEQVSQLGMEVCVTLGMLNADQAKRLKQAGLTAYNHNLDTGENYYDKIISTRTYKDRLETLQNVRNADINVCCGGIIGLGETAEDRIDLIHTLSTLPEHPESVPVNALVAVKGTPLADQIPVDVLEMVRMIATARIAMPQAIVRLSAGRVSMSVSDQAMCFFVGANSIFTGEKLLTTNNCDFDEDDQMFQVLGLEPLEPKSCKR